MKHPTTPLFVLEKSANDLLVFDSVDDALGCLEPIDVNNGEYAAYDGEGIPVALRTDGKRVTAERAGDAPTHRTELEKLLRQFLTSRGSQASHVENATLEELVRLSREHVYVPWRFKTRKR